MTKQQTELSPAVANGLQWESFAVRSSDAVFLVLVALLSTLTCYQFAAGNQLEQLPIIMRQMDADFLSRDFFLNTADSFGPRTYYVELLGLIGQWIPVAWTYLILTWCTDLLLAGVTFWVAGQVIGSSRLGAMLSVVMTLGLASFHLGDATQIRYEVFQPASLALPLTLAAIGCGLLGRPVWAALLAVVASLPHPLYGAEGGGIALGLAFLALLFSPERSSAAGVRCNLKPGRALLFTALGALILGAGLVLFWLLPYQAVVAGEKLPTAQFFQILAHYRAPHHYLPSQFRLNDYVSATAFIAMTGLCFVLWLRGGMGRRLYLLMVLVVTVLFCCLLGFLFAEVWPNRAALTLQLFRLLSLLKWVGYLLLGGVLAACIQRPREWVERPLALVSLFSTGVAQPLVSAMSLFLLTCKPWCWLSGTRVWVVGAAVVVALAVNGLLASADELVYLLLALALVFVVARPYRFAQLGYAAALVVLCVFLIANRGASLGVQLAALAPTLDYVDHHDRDAEMARALRQHTPAGALLLVPPHMGVVRVIGERAIVVDYKSIPFQDAAMLEWYRRMNRVYGEVDGGGFGALRQMDASWREVSDAHLQQLAKEFGADYAVLYAQTQTGLPVIYSNPDYQLVQL